MTDKQERDAARHGIIGKYAYAWLTLAFFLICLVLQWYFGWQAYVDEAQGHLDEIGRDTFENWQSEILQLLWQVVGLGYFLYLGSPSSKEGDDRMEAKLDALIRLKAGDDGEAIIRDIDHRFLRHHGHAKPMNYEQEVPR